MKKVFYVLLAVAATLSFAACDNDIKEENGPEITELESGELTFTLAKSDIQTRSESDIPALKQGVTLSLGEPVEGQHVYLEETVASLDDIYYGTPETRGTPIYTENFQIASGGTFRGFAWAAARLVDEGATLDSATPLPDGDFVAVRPNLWKRDFNWGPFTDLIFFARMLTENTTSPETDPIGVLPSTYRFFYNPSGNIPQRVRFSYRSPLTAQAQQDILFAGRTITREEAGSPVPILFYHPLTGVKFATAHKNNTSVKTYIKKVEFTGLYGYGECAVTPQAENSDYVDQSGNHSSASAVTWTLSENGNTKLTTVYSQTFSDQSVDYATGGSFSTQGGYPDSFAAAGNENNLNDGNASMTFWFPPQAMTDAVKVKVTFEIEIGGNRIEHTRNIDFGKMLKEANGGTAVTWLPGQIRTYTLKSEEVDVNITDKVSGFEKTDVVITNTGNTDAYIRAYIVANWYGANDNGEDGVAVGYNSAAHTAFVNAWRRTSLTGDNYGGVFENLPGDGWVYKSDGFFYYTRKVAPGESISPTLFTRYYLDTQAHPAPHIWYLGKGEYKEFTNVRLVMEIPVQAVEAKDYTWQQAWAAAGVSF